MAAFLSWWWFFEPGDGAFTSREARTRRLVDECGIIFKGRKMVGRDLHCVNGTTEDAMFDGRATSVSNMLEADGRNRG